MKTNHAAALSLAFALFGCATSGGGGTEGDDGGQSCVLGCTSERSDAGQDAQEAQDAGEAGAPFGAGCGAPMACGTAGHTYAECKTTDPFGSCTAAEYKTSAGQTFSCASCADCTLAEQEVEAACASGSSTPTTTCGASTACGTGGVTYEVCTTTTNGACSGIEYETSDGATYTCASCSDCTTAASELSTHCSGSTGTGGTTCGAAAACGTGGTTYDVCTTTDGNGTCTQIAYQTSDGQTFDCDGCTDCTTAADELTSYCSSSGGQVCGSVTCGSAATCCDCSGTFVCYSLPSGYTCADYGCN